MKKFIASFLLICCSSCFGLQAAYAEETIPVLEFKYTENTSVFITPTPCPAKYKDKYPLTAFAINKKGMTKMFGCYTHKEDIIIIHWDNTEDTTEFNSEFPADLFLGPQSKRNKPDTI